MHPGYLVDDPEGYQNELVSDIGALEDKLDLWLISGAERFAPRSRPAPGAAHVARHADSRMCLVLLGTILENPGLAERLMEVLKAPARPRQRDEIEEAFMTWSDVYLICFLVGVRPERAVAAGRKRAPASAAPAFASPVSTCRHAHAGAGGHGAGCRVQLRHHRRVPGVVRRHRLSAAALLRRLVCRDAGDGRS